MNQTHVLVVEDDQVLREAICDTLSLAGFGYMSAENASDAIKLVTKNTPDMVITDVNMTGMDGHQLLRHLKRDYPQLPVLLVTAFGSVANAVEAIREGAVDYLLKPFEPKVLVDMVQRYALIKGAGDNLPIAEDPVSKETFAIASKVAATTATVMITGPSGSGKEVLSRFIHNASARADQPFVAINCAAIPENMLEATLFGYEKGAFTGAYQACPGKFEQAQGGTLLLDEISEMDLSLQAKLLRVLQESEVERLGARKTIVLDVRILATSNRNLAKEVAQGRFREDLYYRINVFPICWQPLSQRVRDIVPIAERLLTLHSAKSAITGLKLSLLAANKLTTHHWPGNVRELENVMQRALILHTGNEIEADDIHFEQAVAVRTQGSSSVAEKDKKLGHGVQEHEHEMIVKTLVSEQGNRKSTAEILGISPRTLRYKLARMRDLGLALPA